MNLVDSHRVRLRLPPVFAVETAERQLRQDGRALHMDHVDEFRVLRHERVVVQVHHPVEIAVVSRHARKAPYNQPHAAARQLVVDGVGNLVDAAAGSRDALPRRRAHEPVFQPQPTDLDGLEYLPVHAFRLSFVVVFRGRV